MKVVKIMNNVDVLNLRTFYDSHKDCCCCCCVLFWSGPVSHFGKNALVGIQGDLKPILSRIYPKHNGTFSQKNIQWECEELGWRNTGLSVGPMESIVAFDMRG